MVEENKKDIDMEGYDLPEVETTEIDVTSQEGKEEKVPFNDLPHLEKIRIVSEQHGVKISKPKKSCNHCYGRGYISVKTLATSDKEEEAIEMPNPCKCIFKKEDRGQMFTGNIILGRSGIRKQEKFDMDQKGKKISHAMNVIIQKNNKEKAKKLKAKRKLRKKQIKMNRK